MSERRPTYRIPAREVVPGMRQAPGWPIVEMRHNAGRIGVVWQDDSGGQKVSDCYWLAPEAFVSIQLPGPSPRELACMCKPGMGRGPVKHAVVHAPDATVIEDTLRPWRCAPAAEHLPGCPVAPVPGRHGGMRIWPAPFKGAPWTWNRHSRVLIVPHGPAVSAHCLLDDLPAGLVAPCTADLLWHCFYLPPEPQEERREPTPWAPHAGYDDLAVRYG